MEFYNFTRPGPSPNMLPVPHPNPISFYSSPLYLQSALTILSSLHVYFNAYMPVTLELFNDALRTSEVILTSKEWYYGTGFQVCNYSIYFWEGSTTKIPEKTKSVEFVFGVPTVPRA
jgi:hypothetical protein